MKKHTFKCEWVKDNNEQKVGHLIAFTDWQSGYQNVLIGFSFCDKRYDKWDKNIAECISEEKAFYLANAKNVQKIIESVPYKHRAQFKFFVTKCKRYFKDRTLPEWTKEIENF